MARSIGVAVGLGLLFLAGWNCVACGSTESRPGPALAAAGAGMVGSGGGLGLNLGGDGNGPGPGLSDKCAEKISTAQTIPLDIYIMLDVSGSMLDLTATQMSKWDAVKAALQSFLTDKASAGLGVGLQYFPLLKANVPATCKSNAECGDTGGPCFLKFCFQSSNFFPCQTDADCLTSSGDDAGPCLDIAQCSKNQAYICPNPGQRCTATDTTEDLGTCVKLTESVCQRGTSCEVAQYTAPATAIAALPGAAAGLIASIDAKMPSGNTPTGPALSGAIQQASSWATAHPDHRVVAVLATDGLPTECTPDTINGVAALARTGVNGTPSINTFVIGVFGPDDVANGAPTNLDRIAQQGGTNKAFIVDTQKDVTVQFQAALDAIRGARLACEYQIPQPTGGASVDYDQVNVVLTNGNQRNVVFFVGDPAACDANTGGWYYDVDPRVAPPSRIIACPSTCSTFQAAPAGASVGIALDCETVVK